MSALSDSLSKTITTAKQSQTICEATATATYFFFKNNSRESFFLRFNAPADDKPHSLEVKAGDSYDSMIPLIVQAQINVYCKKAGMSFTVLQIA